MSTVNTELFDVFVQAKAALEELPAAKAEAAQLRDSVETGNAIIAQMTDEAKALREQLAAAQAVIAQREAELAQATFRHAEAASLLGNMRRLLGADVVVDSVEPTVTEVHQEPMAQAEPSASAEPASTEPTPTTPPAPFTPPAALEVATAEPSANPSDSAGDGMTASSGIISPPGTPEPITADGSNRPYANLNYWRKPDAMPWSTWRDGGGEIPHWVAHDYNEPLIA